MQKAHQRHLLPALLASLALLLACVQPAGAEGDERVEVTGTVTSIDEAVGQFVIETEDGTQITIVPEKNFNFKRIAVGEVVEVEGTRNEDGSIAATKIRVENGSLGDDPTEAYGGYFCTQSDELHPFGALLVERYDTDYETLQAWFCEGFGWGQIMLALQTSGISGDDPGALLTQRAGGAGWGQIWQGLNLIGRPEDAGPPNDLDGDGKPDHAGKPNDEDGDGKPDHAGPPNDADGDGRPDHVGTPPGRP